MIEVIETLPNGVVVTVKLSSIFGDGKFRDQYLKDREDMRTLGAEGALQKWHDEEAVERRKLGLKVKKRY